MDNLWTAQMPMSKLASKNSYRCLSPAAPQQSNTLHLDLKKTYQLKLSNKIIMLSTEPFWSIDQIWN